MKGNTNKLIAFNTLILYVRMVFNAICTLFITRYALKALGVVDFGLFSVLGSIMSLITIFNTIMLSTSNRFISVAIGKGNIADINEQFNVNLVIHVCISILTLSIALPISDWYVLNYINYDGNISNALIVTRLSVIASCVSFIGVPYNGLLVAKEKFIVFCSADVIGHVIKLIVAYLISIMFVEKLIVYAVAIAIITSFPTFVYIAYCKRVYREITKFKFVTNKNRYKEVFTFSSWVAYGAVATVGRQQGAAVLVNMFFSTVMNASLGIANTVCSLVSLVSQNITQPIAPQITKSFAAGDFERCDTLLILSAKVTYISALIVCSPFIIDPNWILGLWLEKVPPYVVVLITLLMIDLLISSFNSGISIIIFASGKIKLYQILINSLRFCTILVAFFILRNGAPVLAMFYTYICFSIIIFVATQWVLHKTLNYDNTILWRKAYLPNLAVTIMFVPYIFLGLSPFPLVRIIVGMFYLCTLIYVFSLSESERASIAGIIKKRK